MPAYKCHACPSAWAWEHFVRIAHTPRSRRFRLSVRADPSCPALRSNLPSANLSFFGLSHLIPEIPRMPSSVNTEHYDLDLQDAEKCVAWGVNARRASLRGSLRSFSCPEQGHRDHYPAEGVTGSERWTSPLLWRGRHVDLTRRSRGPTVTRAFALQDYS